MIAVLIVVFMSLYISDKGILNCYRCVQSLRSFSQSFRPTGELAYTFTECWFWILGVLNYISGSGQ